jgi:phosphoserine aminotransferase
VTASRLHIFTAGPAVLPVPVLDGLAEDVRSFEGSGQSLLELSHRSPAYCDVQNQAEGALRRLLGLGDDHLVLFVPGGASLQFSMLPMNLRPAGVSADYLDSGTWSKKAIQAAERCGVTRVAASSSGQAYRALPSRFDEDPTAAYLHYTSNNTIAGTQWPSAPESRGPTLVCDASSDLLSRPIEVDRHVAIYAGAQKNCGAAGVTVVIVKRSAVESIAGETRAAMPPMLDYALHAEKSSRYNTPPVFSVRSVGRVCAWIEERGGLAAMAERNAAKAAQLYDLIESSESYEAIAAEGGRSLMNVCFRLTKRDLEARFLSESAEAGFVGLAGHRSVGGLRASLYNALPPSSVAALCDFMESFARRHDAASAGEAG